MSVQIEIWAEDSRGPPGPNLNRKKYAKMWRNLMVPRFNQILGLGSGVFREALRHARANLGDFAALKVLALTRFRELWPCTQRVHHPHPDLPRA